MVTPDFQAGPLSRRLGEETRHRREANGWSQQDLAQDMQARGFRWYQTTVNRVETGARTISFDEAAALALALDFDLSALAASDLNRALDTHQQLYLEVAEQEERLLALRGQLEQAEVNLQAELNAQAAHAPTFRRPPDLTEEELTEMYQRDLAALRKRSKRKGAS